MQTRVYAQPAALSGDHALLVVGLGNLGACVLENLRQEFDRLQMSPDQVRLLIWNPTAKSGEDNNLFERFDVAEYLQDARHESLRQQISHLEVAEVIRDAADQRQLAASGYVALHHNESHSLLLTIQKALDDLRQANPERLLRLLVLGDLGEGCVAGSLSPLLVHLRPHVTLRKVELDVWVTGGDVQQADDVQQLQSDLQCASSVQHLKDFVLGDGSRNIPGTHGLREDRVEEGPRLSQVTLFGAGDDATRHSPNVLASIIANSLLAHESTPLHRTLQEERDYHGEEILEQKWTNEYGEPSPTRCATFQAGGIKADVMPAVLHLRTVRFFIDRVTRALEKAGRDKAHSAALHCIENARLGIGEIVEDLEVGSHPLTLGEVRQGNIAKPQLHAYIKGRLDEDLGELLDLAKRKNPPPTYAPLIDRAQQHCEQQALTLAHSDAAYLPAAVEFYRSLEKELQRLSATVEERRAWAQRELGSSPSRSRLDGLLHRLESDVGDHGDDLHARFAETLTVALPIQIRKIVEVSREVREHALMVGTAPILQRCYTELVNTCQRKRESLQRLIFELNNAAAACARQEEKCQRAARSPFTYQKGRTEKLVDALWDRARFAASGVRMAELLERLEGDLPGLSGAADLEGRLLDAARPEAERLAATGVDIMVSEPLARQALQDAILRLHPMVDLQRDKFGNLQTLRRRFVACTRRFLHAHGDLLQDYQHIETSSPWNVWVSEHEEGFPFEVVGHIADCVDESLAPENADAARRTCATIEDHALLQSSK